MALLDDPITDQIMNFVSTGKNWLRSKLDQHRDFIKPFYDIVRPAANAFLAAKTGGLVRLPEYPEPRTTTYTPPASENTKTKSHPTEAVSGRLLATLVAPERYSSPNTDGEVPIAIAAKRTTGVYMVNAAGCGAMLIFPDNLLAPSTAVGAQCFAMCNQDASYNPTTGTQTPNATVWVGPLNGVANQLSGMFVIAFTVEVTSNVSALNCVGNYVTASYPVPADPSWLTAKPTISTQMIINQSNSNAGKVTPTWRTRVLYVPRQLNMTTALINNTNGYNPVIALQFTGYPANSTLNFIFSWVIEYPPSATASLMVTPMERPFGPATMTAWTALLRKFP